MVDNGYTIKEVSKMLDCSTQNIYRQKSQLISKGLMVKNSENGFYITDDGIKYLREKRIDTMRQSSQDLSSGVDNASKGVATPIIQSVPDNNSNLIQLLQEQIMELKKDRDYWKEAYTKKDAELTNKVEYIQSINTQVFALLGTEEQNKKQAEETKKGFFHWFKK